MATTLQEDALRLAALDRRLIRALMEANHEEFVRVLGEYLTLRRRLQTQLLDETVAVVDDVDAAEVVRKISGGEGLPSDEVIARVSLRIGENIEIHTFDDEEIEELGSELFYSWFSPSEYQRTWRPSSTYPAGCNRGIRFSGHWASETLLRISAIRRGLCSVPHRC